MTLQRLHIKLSVKWVKGHSTSATKSFQEILNGIADDLATSYARNPHHRFCPGTIAPPPPDFKIRFLAEGAVISSKLYHTLSNRLHNPLIIAHIMKKTGWSQRTFNLVD